MDSYKLKIKIGDNEFEADGPVEIVQSQFEAFKELVAAVPTPAAKKSIAEAQSTDDNSSVQSETFALEKITRLDGRIVSLTAHPATVENALLLVLLGQRQLRNNDSVTGSEIIDGLRESGFTLPRVDWRLDRLASNGQIIKIGTGRASRYRLTNSGMKKAQDVARDLLALVP